MSAPKKILVAGIGNIFLGDDAFGSLVAQRLAAKSLPENVAVIDFGIRGLDLVYALLDPWQAVILVDAAPRGLPPGTLSLIQPDLPSAHDQPPAMIDAHSMDPVKVLLLARSMGSTLEKILLVACEPAPLDANIEAMDMQMALSPAVENAIEPAIQMIESTVKELNATTVSEIQHDYDQIANSA